MYENYNVDLFYLDTSLFYLGRVLPGSDQLSLPVATGIRCRIRQGGVLLLVFKRHWMVARWMVVTFLFSMEGSWFWLH